MPFLDEIVTGINEAILQVIPVEAADCAMHGIAEPMVYVDESEDEKSVVKRYPAIMQDDGEAKMITPDDCFKLIVYHKLDSIINGQLKGGYGDSKGDLLETANLSLMVMAFRNGIALKAHELESHIKLNIKDQITIRTEASTVQTSAITFGSSQFDKLPLLQREYSDVELNYQDLIFFEMKYKIESRYNKACFTPCKKKVPAQQ